MFTTKFSSNFVRTTREISLPKRTKPWPRLLMSSDDAAQTHIALYVVPTPIGNLKDITLRAIEVLQQVDLVLAEDTRTTGKLLKHLQIQNSLQSYHIFNEHRSLERLVDRMAKGEQMALVSDAGTPGISDPGFLLVRAVHHAGLQVSCLPGATAFVPAL